MAPKEVWKACVHVVRNYNEEDFNENDEIDAINIDTSPIIYK